MSFLKLYRLRFDAVPPGVEAGDEGWELVPAGWRAFLFRLGESKLSGAAAANGKLNGLAGTTEAGVVGAAGGGGSSAGEDVESAGDDGADMNSGLVISSGKAKSFSSLENGSSSSSFNVSRLYILVRCTHKLSGTMVWFSLTVMSL